MPVTEENLPHLMEAAVDLNNHLMKEQLKWLNESGFAKDARESTAIVLTALQIKIALDLDTVIECDLREAAIEWAKHITRILRDLR